MHILIQDILVTHKLIQGTHIWGTLDASGQPQPCSQVVNIVENLVEFFLTNSFSVLEDHVFALH